MRQAGGRTSPSTLAVSAARSRSQGKYDEALLAEREAIAVGSASGVAPQDLATFRFTVAEILRQQGDADAAQALAAQVLEDRAQLHGPDSVELGPSQRQLAAIANDKGNFALAERLYRRVARDRAPAPRTAAPEAVGVLSDIWARSILRRRSSRKP